MPQKISQEQVTLSHGTVQSLRQLLNTHKTTAFGKTIDRGRAIKSYLFPKHGFDNVFTETKNTLRKDIFLVLAIMEFKTLVEIKGMFTTESSIKTFLHSPSFRKRQVLLSMRTRQYGQQLPPLMFYQKTCVGQCLRLAFQWRWHRHRTETSEQQYYFCPTLTSDGNFTEYSKITCPTLLRQTLRCYRWYSICLKYQANEPATFERCMFIYMNFIMKNSRYQLCVSKNVRVEIEYKLAQAPIGIFDKLFIRCFKELQNSLQGVNRDAKAGIDLQFIHAIQENVKSRISPRSSEDHQKQRKRQKQRARCVIN